MSIETKTDLNEQTVEKLQDLTRINIDAEKGFREAAESIDNMAVAETFRELATQRAANAEELRQYCNCNGEEAVCDGSFSAKFHRVWMDLRGKLNGGDTHVVLCEAERGEDHIKAAYEDALKETAGSAMNDVLMRQYAGVKAGHDRVRDMRDAHAEK